MEKQTLFVTGELIRALFFSLLFLLIGESFFFLLSRFSLAARRFIFGFTLIIFSLTLSLFGRLYLKLPPAYDEYVKLFFLFSVFYLIIRVVDFLTLHRYLKRQRVISFPPLMHKVILGVFYVIAFVLAYKLAFPTKSITGFIVTSAVFSAIVGLSFQDILTNFLSGIILSVEKPFQLGHWVRVAEREGKVEQITWRTTKVRTRENDYIVIPNSSIAKQELINYSSPTTLHLQKIVVGVHYNVPPSKVKQVMLEATRKVEGVLDTPKPEVHLLEFGDFKIDYELRIWIDDYESLLRIEDDIRTMIWYLFKRNGIVIPFPIMTVHFQKKAPTVLHVPRLVVIQGLDEGKSWELGTEPIMVGRGPSCNIRLNDQKVSKEHSQISCHNDKFVLTDQGSTHGTIVNGIAVKQKTLIDGDEVTIGDTVFLFEGGTLI